MCTMSQRSSYKTKEIVGTRQIYRRVQKALQRLNENKETICPVNRNNLANTNIIEHSPLNLLHDRSDENDSSSICSQSSQNCDIQICPPIEIELISENIDEHMESTPPETLCTNPNENDDNLAIKLRSWATVGKVPHSSVTSLLGILHPLHPQLPLCSKTLLKTPVTLNTLPLDTGEYYHFGLTKTLHNLILDGARFDNNTILLSFNIDGLPLYRSTNTQIWPILCLTKSSSSIISPFPIGIFLGDSKPKPLDTYLKNFIEELSLLITNGLNLFDVTYKIKIHSFICDAPARAFIKCIKSHGGYSCCERCMESGDYVNGKVVYKGINATRRTDKSFVLQSDEDHHLGMSPLLKLSVGMVSQFPIDYLHNICLGVMRKLLHTWISGNLKVRLNSQLVTTLSQKLILIKLHIPTEINRKPRSLSDLSRWKGTEFRSFLLYYGPLILANTIDLGAYEHFLLLHVAISIAVSPYLLAIHNSTVVSELLNMFVKHVEQIYGIEYYVYNVHYLSHVSDDIQSYGCLDNYSAFPFENYLGQLKQLVRTPNRPLAQLCRRLHEMSFNNISKPIVNPDIVYKFEHFNGPLPPTSVINDNYRQYKKIHWKDITISVKSHSIADCYCLTKQKTVVQIENILACINRKNTFFIVSEFEKYDSLYHYPINSKQLYIYKMKNLSTNMKIISHIDIQAKCIVIPSFAADYW
ncbi:hypothetical protein PPYR_15576, partial [Photinus pyralis]